MVWVGIGLLGFSATGGPTYENRTFRNLLILKAKPNRPLALVFVQPLILLHRRQDAAKS